MANEHRIAWRDRLQDLAIRGVLGLALRIPYERRVPLMGWVAARVVAPLAGWNRRISDNLAAICPDVPPDEVRRLQRAVPDNLGRSLIEIYSGAEFAARIREMPLRGPGLDALRTARAEGRAAVLVTGHLGNFDAPRAALFAQGLPLAGLYRPMHNESFNAHYVRALSGIGEPMFPTDRRGIVGFIRHIAAGGFAGMLIDVYTDKGAPLMFFGKLAPTALSAAQWAIDHDALFVVGFGIRQPDGLSFDIVIEAPIPHGTAEEMTQAANDAIEAQARAHMGQYLWIHQRWKRRYLRHRKRAAARTGP